MLENVIKLGKILRKNPKYHLKYHRYIKQYLYNDKEKDTAIVLSIKVNKDFTFDFDKTKEIVTECEKDNLFYYTFKTSDRDSNVKYIFGDIYYKYDKGNEQGYKLQKTSSFERGDKDSETIVELYKKHLDKQNLTPVKSDKLIKSFPLIIFRKEFNKNLTKINNILKYSNGIKEYFKSYKKEIIFSKLVKNEKQLKKLTIENIYNKAGKKELKKIFNNENIKLKDILSSESNTNRLLENQVNKIFIHFDFCGKSWFDLEEVMSSLNIKLLEDFVGYSEKVKGYYLTKYLYKTLVENNIFPEDTYKNKYFNSEDEILDLLYAIDISRKAKVQIKFYNENLKPITTNVKVVVLPRGDKIKADQIDEFFSIAKDIEKEQTSEEDMAVTQDNIEQTQELEVDGTAEPILDNILNHETPELIQNITQFDLIFSKTSQSSPDVDMIEISGIYKSKLASVYESIKTIKKELLKKWKEEHGERKFFINIEMAFSRILNNNTKDQKKYQSHIYKTIPLIYKKDYYNDPILLPLFIEAVQKGIRNGENNFNVTKYSFYFLEYLQTYNKEGKINMKITESPCYNMGILLGKMAYPLKFEMASFEKNYAGNLTRRVTKLPDLIKLKTFIEEKLTVHNKYYPDLKNISLELTENIKNFSVPYDKNEVAFGFFESFLKYKPKDLTKPDNDSTNLNITGETNESNQ